MSKCTFYNTCEMVLSTLEIKPQEWHLTCEGTSILFSLMPVPIFTFPPTGYKSSLFSSFLRLHWSRKLRELREQATWIPEGRGLQTETSPQAVKQQHVSHITPGNRAVRMREQIARNEVKDYLRELIGKIIQDFEDFLSINLSKKSQRIGSMLPGLCFKRKTHIISDRSLSEYFPPASSTSAKTVSVSPIFLF